MDWWNPCKLSVRSARVTRIAGVRTGRWMASFLEKSCCLPHAPHMFVENAGKCGGIAQSLGESPHSLASLVVFRLAGAVLNG